VSEEVVQAEAIEETTADADEQVVEARPVRPLPEKVNGREVDSWRGEVRTAALAAAGGVVAGAATVAVVRAASRGGGKRRKPVLRQSRRQERPGNVIASRSFLVDVHLLGR
jgi:hypothetical protein